MNTLQVLLALIFLAAVICQLLLWRTTISQLRSTGWTDPQFRAHMWWDPAFVWYAIFWRDRRLNDAALTHHFNRYRLVLALGFAAWFGLLLLLIL